MPYHTTHPTTTDQKHIQIHNKTQTHKQPNRDQNRNDTRPVRVHHQEQQKKTDKHHNQRIEQTLPNKPGQKNQKHGLAQHSPATTDQIQHFIQTKLFPQRTERTKNKTAHRKLKKQPYTKY